VDFIFKSDYIFVAFLYFQTSHIKLSKKIKILKPFCLSITLFFFCSMTTVLTMSKRKQLDEALQEI
jgi:hypothetical protein